MRNEGICLPGCFAYAVKDAVLFIASVGVNMGLRHLSLTGVSCIPGFGVGSSVSTVKKELLRRHTVPSARDRTSSPTRVFLCQLLWLCKYTLLCQKNRANVQRGTCALISVGMYFFGCSWHFELKHIRPSKNCILNPLKNTE